jgi:hypothetical protein
MMERKQTYGTLYVPTIAVEGETRHIIRHKDGPTLCGVPSEGEQTAPREWRRRDLCPRCVQVYVREIIGKAEW